MHKNAYGKKPHHFREKTPLIPSQQAATHAWSEHLTPEGLRYYYNTATGTSSWDRPHELSQHTRFMATTTHAAPLAMVERLQRPACVGYSRDIVRGTIYAHRGGAGFGLYDKWGDEPRGLCFVAKFEYSHNNPNPGTKFGSFDEARTAAIRSLLHACSGEERASVQAVLDSDQREAAAAAARAQAERDAAEAERRAVAEARVAEHRKAANEQREAEAAARRAAQAATAEAVERSKGQATIRRQMEPTEQAEERSTALELEYLTVLHRWALERDQPKGARSKASKKRRYAKLKAKHPMRKQVTVGDRNNGGAQGSEGGPYDVHALLREAELRTKALQQKLESSEALRKAERKRSRRDKKTVAHRARQAERSNGKAASRKRKAGRQAERKRAERKQDERVSKRKVPTGEPLHSGERKHRRLTDGNGGCD